MIFILNFVTVTKGTYPIIARDFFASIRFYSKLMTTYSPTRYILYHGGAN